MINLFRPSQEIIGRGKIEKKGEFYKLYNLGFFGNRPLCWDSLDEIKESGWTGKICIRGRHGISREKSRYNLTIEEARDYIFSLTKKNISEGDLVFNQSMPDEYLILQGEVQRSEDYFWLTYSTIKKPMNLALKEKTSSANSIEAILLLRKNMNPSSYNDLQELFDYFPDSVIEFSSYRICVGDRKNRNTIFWEVRNY